MWVEKSSATAAELQSLVGSLSFACKVVRPGRIYLSRLIAHMAQCLRITNSRTRHQLRLPSEVKEDVRWWARWIEEWNGCSLLYDLEWTAAAKLELYTDACLTGFGALFGTEWFAGRWTDEQLAAAKRTDAHSMPFLEFFALVSAAATFGESLRGRRVLFWCDCQPVVQAIRSKSSDKPEMTHLLRLLTEIACKFGFEFRADHVPGVRNIAADLLSRHGDCPQFRAQFPHALRAPTPIAPLPLPPSPPGAPRC